MKKFNRIGFEKAIMNWWLNEKQNPVLVRQRSNSVKTLVKELHENYVMPLLGASVEVDLDNIEDFTPAQLDNILKGIIQSGTVDEGNRIKALTMYREIKGFKNREEDIEVQVVKFSETMGCTPEGKSLLKDMKSNRSVYLKGDKDASKLPHDRI